MAEFDNFVIGLLKEVSFPSFQVFLKCFYLLFEQFQERLTCGHGTDRSFDTFDTMFRVTVMFVTFRDVSAVVVGWMAALLCLILIKGPACCHVMASPQKRSVEKGREMCELTDLVWK